MTLTKLTLLAVVLAPMAAFAGGENSPATGEHRSVNDPLSPRSTYDRGWFWSDRSDMNRNMEMSRQERDALHRKHYDYRSNNM